MATSLAYTTAVSLVPLLAVSLSIFTAFGGLESLLHKIEPFILQNLADASGAQLSKGVRIALDRVHSRALGMGGALGLMIASTKLFHDMEKAVHRVWGIPSTRKIWRQFLIYWILMFVGPILLAVVLGILGSKDLDLIGPHTRGPIVMVFEFFGLLAMYKAVPSVRVAWISALLSAVVATCALGLAQAFYSSIMRTFFSTNKIYGSFASIPLFLIWILVLWWICLTGCAYCAVLEKRRLARG